MGLYTYRAKLKKVIDGDTVDVYIDLGFDIHYLSRARLFGINTPETRTRNLEEKKAGLIAKEYVEKWFEKNEGQCVINTIKDEKGKYGRILANIYDIKEESILNVELVNLGLAREYDGHSDKTWPEFRN